MLYYLLYPLRNYISGFNVFRYITFRTAWAALTALVISFILGPWLIDRMRQIKLRQYIREEGPKSHQLKAGTPTMGALLINVAILIPTLLWADIANPYVWIVLFVTFAYGAIGFVDDYGKPPKTHHLALTNQQKHSPQRAATATAHRHDTYTFVVRPRLCSLASLRSFSLYPLAHYATRPHMPIPT